ncbi:MAG: ATP-dependent DNA helicase RecG [Rickettsiales bacterium]
MRHEILNYLFSAVTRVKGVGGSATGALQRLLPASTVVSGASIPIIRDLLFHLPVGLLDRRFTCSLREAPDGVIATFVVRVESHQPPLASARRYGRKPYKVICSNETGDIALIFFNPREDYLKQALPVGQMRVISGRTEKFDYRVQMTHPDIITTVDKLAEVQRPEAVYPLTVGMTSRRIAKLVTEGLDKTPELPEWIAEEMLVARNWQSWKQSLLASHHPETPDDLQPISPARMRLAYDEMLANQLHLAILRSKRQHQAGEIITGTGKMTEILLRELPYALTNGQMVVLNEISEDIASGNRMGRLLQGDVGSGKTIVALLSMLRAVEQGLQCALMVPTEIVAGQHYEVISRLVQSLNISVSLLTGRVKGKERAHVLEGLASGKTQIIIGTHALFQEHVEFSNLAFIVIDEQHRFGVNQRMALSSKGNAPHVLHMTATPIPRSLTMTLYGDMECSLLKEKPAQRKAITTRVIPLSRYDEIMERLSAALSRGEKVYWICPLIEDNSNQDSLDITPENDIAAAKSRYIEFKARFGDIVGLVHGQMKGEQRDEIMQDFATGKTRLLVATTVVEVGVDVRDATIIVIEKAERFGLSQLHQLRGRVGRGDKASACVLLCSDKTTEVAQSRLAILRETEDGFRIAEADLAIRGGGDLLGTRQSGLPRFIFTDLFEHQELLEQARADIVEFMESKQAMDSPRGKALELLLQLFGYQ